MPKVSSLAFALLVRDVRAEASRTRDLWESKRREIETWGKARTREEARDFRVAKAFVREGFMLAARLERRADYWAALLAESLSRPL